jgi:hypothetical protein
LLKRFGGEEKLKEFLLKLTLSIGQDENFAIVRQSVQDLKLTENFSKEGLISQAKSMFDCENLSQIGDQKALLRKLCISQEIFDCFYKDHFSKHLKTIKVNIKIV